MSKKRKTHVPDFSSARTPGVPKDRPLPVKGARPAVAQTVKPRATSAKSGHRGS